MPILRILHEASESCRFFPETPPLPSPSSSSYIVSSMSESQHEPIDSSLTPEEASRIIHSHRKVRYGEITASILFPLYTDIIKFAENFHRHCLLALSTAQS